MEVQDAALLAPDLLRPRVKTMTLLLYHRRFSLRLYKLVLLHLAKLLDHSCSDQQAFDHSVDLVDVLRYWQHRFLAARTERPSVLEIYFELFQRTQGCLT